jgi:hypothetical protein
MLKLEAIRGDFDDDGIERVVDHLLEELGLLSLP